MSIKKVLFNKYFWLLIIVCIYIFVHLNLLFTVLNKKKLDFDELAIGAITRDIIRGRTFHIFDYQFPKHVNGMVFDGILAVPFFLLFGSSYFSLKLMALALSTGTLILWYLLSEKYFGKRVALITGLLFCFSPPIYSYLSIKLTGLHSETCFFIILAIFVWYRIFFDDKKNIKNFIIFGLICGFSLYLH